MYGRFFCLFLSANLSYMKSPYFIFIFLFTIFCQGQTQLTMEKISSAYKLSKSGDYKKAADQIAVLKKSASPKDSLYSILIGISVDVNMKAYNYHAAINNMEELLVLMPDEEQTCLTNIACCSRYLDDTDKNIAISKKIVKKYPDNEIVYGNLANTYNYLKQYDKALEVLNGRPGKHFYTEDFQYAQAYFGLKQYGKAKEYIEKYLAYENNDKSRNIGAGPIGEYIAHKLAAQIYNALGNKDKSCNSITKAAQLAADQKVLENFNAMPEKVKAQKLAKDKIAEVSELGKLKAQYCK